MKLKIILLLILVSIISIASAYTYKTWKDKKELSEKRSNILKLVKDHDKIVANLMDEYDKDSPDTPAIRNILEKSDSSLEKLKEETQAYLKLDNSKSKEFKELNSKFEDLNQYIKEDVSYIEDTFETWQEILAFIVKINTSTYPSSISQLRVVYNEQKNEVEQFKVVLQSAKPSEKYKKLNQYGIDILQDLSDGFNYAISGIDTLNTSLISMAKEKFVRDVPNNQALIQQEMEKITDEENAYFDDINDEIDKIIKDIEG